MLATDECPPAFRRTQTAKPRVLYKGLDALAQRGLGVIRTRRVSDIDGLRAESEGILALGERWRTARLDELVRHLASLRDDVRRDGRAGTSVEVRRKAIAGLCEAAFRTVHLRAYPEQVMGVLALENGCLAEMATGEGKTLTLGLAAALAGWRGGPVHVLTANDYLVERDAEWLQGFFEMCGLRVGFVTGVMGPAGRKTGYGADVTYATSKEVVADFLRDRLQMARVVEPARRLIRQVLQPGVNHDAGLVMRGLETAIVDEADHVLIDEAVTPLIISREAPSGDLPDACRRAAEIARRLEAGRDYLVEARWKDIVLPERTRARLEELTAGFSGLWRNPARREELVLTALKAREFFRRDQQYVVSPEGKVVIVDESTGRVMPQRTWKQGLHQAIEAKEGLRLTPPTETLARLSFQRFFRLYPRLSGVTGTAREARGELWQIYGLPVVVIPTHRPCVRRRPADRIFPTAEKKWVAVVAEIARLHSERVPVLVGTRSVEASELLAARLRETGLDFQLLNAVHNDREARMIEQAGDEARITIATNMAGRGTDIKLPPGVAGRGGLHVLATESHESGRVDRQLFGRSARQGEPGSALMMISLEDELLRRFAGPVTRRAIGWLVRTRSAAAAAVAWRLVRLAQRRAERLAFRQRRQILAQDDWLEESLAFAKTGAE
jgi:preprotein translocase subunit SecA